ncbi:Methyltransferase-like protein 17, mitochondrial [Habropoda laboriosa]|uniref:Methyltransferase-like protein 17, mitochondrial n=1 Tax=Habropoda laboriosa TaxID=597456 RepID=A0A0L7QSD6_9HYME|nr:Methyltransferase-like protein 17, mitochondrial [Habropoda laboriosa]
MKVIETVNELILNKELKPKNYPGAIHPKKIEQPTWLTGTILTILKDETISPKVIYASSKKLALHLHNRHVPLEAEDIKLKLQEVRSRLQIDDTKHLSNEELLQDPKAKALFRSLCYNWAPISYDKYTCLTYLVGRSVPEYTVLYRIFKEIVDNDKSFIPKTLFDFGSGIGTVMWSASQFWANSIKEYYCVDISSDIQKLSEYLITKATPAINPNYIFYRQFLPSTSIRTYDIVVSAYSLLELLNQKARIETIMKLWQKTEQYLVIVEPGTRVGYKIINEARDFILNYGSEIEGAHVFSPVSKILV